MAASPAAAAAVHEEEAANECPWYGVVSVGGSVAGPLPLSSQAAFPPAPPPAPVPIPAEVEAAIKRAASQPAAVLPSPEQLEVEGRAILTVWAQDGTHVEGMLLDTIVKRVRERSNILSYFTISNGWFGRKVGLVKTIVCLFCAWVSQCSAVLPVHYCTTSPTYVVLLVRSPRRRRPSARTSAWMASP